MSCTLQSQKVQLCGQMFQQNQNRIKFYVNKFVRSPDEAEGKRNEGGQSRDTPPIKGHQLRDELQQVFWLTGGQLLLTQL